MIAANRVITFQDAVHVLILPDLVQLALAVILWLHHYIALLVAQLDTVVHASTLNPDHLRVAQVAFLVTVRYDILMENFIVLSM